MMSETHKGILFGVLAGVFWGFPFLVPQMLSTYSALEVAFGRFLFFGLVSMGWLPSVVRMLKAMNWSQRRQVFVLSACGFWFYSWILFWGVQQSDGVISSLIIGMLPLTISLASGARWSARLWMGLLFIVIGLASLFLDQWQMLHLPSVSALISLLSCLALWTYYAVKNTQFLQTHRHISPRDLTNVMGVISAIAVALVFASQDGLTVLSARRDLSQYFFWSAVLGVGASWFANWLWNLSSSRVSASISGPLIVSETVFGLVYSYFFETRWPRPLEWTAQILLILGVILSVRSQTQSGLDVESRKSL